MVVGYGIETGHSQYDEPIGLIIQDSDWSNFRLLECAPLCYVSSSTRWLICLSMSLVGTIPLNDNSFGIYIVVW